MTSSRLTIQFQQQLLFILTYKNNVGCIWFPSRKKGIKLRYIPYAPHYNLLLNTNHHGLRTPREEIAFTARPKTQSQSQIFRYGGSIFCLPHRPNFSDIFDLCLHWVFVVRVWDLWFGSQILCFKIQLLCLLLIRWRQTYE